MPSIKIKHNALGFLCQFPECNQIFKYRSHIIRHSHTHIELRLHKCTICLKKFKRKDSLRRHKEYHRTGNTMFTCAYCGKQYKHKCTLEYHIEHKHSNDPIVYKCNVCAKEFKNEKNLKYHLNKHAEKCLFKCEMCDLKFFNPWSKSRHKKKEVIYLNLNNFNSYKYYNLVIFFFSILHSEELETVD